MTAAGALVGSLVFAGCQVTTAIGVDLKAGGAGNVTVRLVLDRQAAAEVGLLGPGQGPSGAAGRGLDVAGLAAAGWHVARPVSTAGGLVLVARHHFADVGQLPSVLAGVLAADGHPLLRLTVRRRTTFWASEVRLRGAVDLSCGVACFGDAGLQRAFGSPVGVSVPALEHRYRETPREALRFAVMVDSPYPVVRTNASRRSGRRLVWTPQLGATTTLAATARRPDRAHAVLVEVAGAVAGVLVLGAAAGFAYRRRRRRRRQWAHLATGAE